jgi:signal transduction histidine kinase
LKRAEEQLREANALLRVARDEAQAAAAAKSEFLANMSHEIRTPLTAIVGFAGLLAQRDDLPPAAARYAKRIAAAGEMLVSVVNNVLDFSKIEAGQIELDLETFDPAAFVVDTLELVTALAEAKGLSLRHDIDVRLPSAVRADSSRIRQVLLNLLTNAIKFTAAGSVTVGVSHHPEQGGRLRFVVTDTGIGIPPDRMDRLFQRFSQVDGAINREFGGSGLGLAICKGLAEAMGGEAGAESREGVGSTFWFTVKAPKVGRAAKREKLAGTKRSSKPRKTGGNRS